MRFLFMLAIGWDELRTVLIPQTLTVCPLLKAPCINLSGFTLNSYFEPVQFPMLFDSEKKSGINAILVGSCFWEFCHQMKRKLQDQSR